ncbi:MAG: hypothetical protein JFR38_06095 [Muribaculaceae bacterium]|nr:hypothetical protein [Muribaculaceae bacterium]
MEDRKLTEKESLEVITSMIARTKAKYLGSGNILLMWGYLIAITSILVWALLAATHHNAWNWLWFAIPAVGVPATIVMSRKEQQVNGVTTSFDKITSRMWTIFGVSEIVLTFVCLAFAFLGGVNCWAAMLVYSLILAPGTEIAQGLIFKENSLVGGGAAGLIVGIITICCVVGGIPLAANWYMPLFILAWVCMMIIPGHIINSKSKKR